MNTLLLHIVLAFIISAICTMVTLPIIILFCRKYVLFDNPNARKVHHEAIPRLGGLAFLPAMSISSIFSVIAYSVAANLPLVFQWSAGLMILGTSAIYIVGILDDLMELRAITKFFIMAFSATIMPLCNLMINNLYGFLGIYEIPNWVAYPLTVLVIMTIVNAINLIDGIDGLASGISIIPLILFTYLYARMNAPAFAIGSAALLGAVLIFFLFNVFGKSGGYKIFMGDAGSLFLGYILAYLSIKYLMLNEEVFTFHGDALLTPYTFLIVPVFDLVRVAFTRLYLHIPIFKADKRHIHHVLMGCGYTMHQTLAIILGLVLFFMVLNYALFLWGIPSTIIVLVDIMVYAVLSVYATRRAGIE